MSKLKLRHTSDSICPLCEHKLIQAHPYIANWFRWVKNKYINVHVAWAFRGEADQTAAVISGASKRPWPTSKHNHTELVGDAILPRSLALDLFLIDEDGIAQWPPLFYARVNKESLDEKYQVMWAGLWKGTFKETCHFEINV